MGKLQVGIKANGEGKKKIREYLCKEEDPAVSYHNQLMIRLLNNKWHQFCGMWTV